MEAYQMKGFPFAFRLSVFNTLIISISLWLVLFIGKLFLLYYAGLGWEGPPVFKLFLSDGLIYASVVFLFLVLKGDLSLMKRVVILFIPVVVGGVITAKTSFPLYVYLRGFSRAVERTNLKPVERWAAAHLPSEEMGWVTVRPAEIPIEVRQVIPFREDRPTISLIRLAGEGHFYIEMAWGYGISRSYGIFIARGQYVDPRNIGVSPIVRLTSPGVWVYVL